MLRLRKILLSNYTYIILLIITFIISIIRLNIKTIYYKERAYIVEAKILNIKIDYDKLTLLVKSKEKLICNYKFKNIKEKNIFLNKIDIGDKIKLYGEINLPSKSKTKNIFDYKIYLNRNKIYHTFKIKNYRLLHKNKNPFITLRNIIRKRSNDKYINALIIGNKDDLESEVLDSYRTNGVSHLLAISGMHISILSGIILKLLKKLTSSKRIFITSLILLFYLFITGAGASIIRGVLFFIVFKYNTEYYFYISKKNAFILILCITILYNPSYIYDIGFIYSFLISASLLITTDFISSNNYIISLLKTSLVSFLISIPISLYNFSSINILSIIYNLFFVPYLTFIVFPLSLIKFLTGTNFIYTYLTSIMENTSLFLANIKILQFNFYKLNILIYLIYLIIVIVIFTIKNKKYKKILLLIYLLLLISHYFYPTITNQKYVNIIDVGQGDSILIRENKVILIDTGGNFQNKKYKKKSSISSRVTIPYLKSLGINKIDYMIITHGDNDHIGESVNIVNNFRIGKVVLNCGPFNNLEKKLIKVLDKNNIGYTSCINNIDLGNNKMYFLNTRIYNNENDNSQVSYIKINNYKFMFMGDASSITEYNILNKYNIGQIDFLKVGHHGSDTSSSKKFINRIKPKYSLISVGENNKYGHPKQVVLNTLKNTKIYRTDEDGSIEIRLNNNGYKIITYKQ